MTSSRPWFRRDIFTIRTDPLSPKRGQYAFAQGCCGRWPYEMIAKRERAPLHLAAAKHLRETFPNDGEELAEVIAAHLLRRLIAPARRLRRRRAADGGPAGAAPGGAARRHDRAPDAAERLLRSAIELSGGGRRARQLLEEAGPDGRVGGEPRGHRALERAISIHAAAGGNAMPLAWSGRSGRSLGLLGRNEEAATRTCCARILRRLRDRACRGQCSTTRSVSRCSTRKPRRSWNGFAPSRHPRWRAALDAAEALEMPDLTVRSLNARGWRRRMPAATKRRGPVRGRPGDGRA